jgi:hypothetical protein
MLGYNSLALNWPQQIENSTLQLGVTNIVGNVVIPNLGIELAVLKGRGFGVF